ncbi:ACR3 family arsenite efflux transporter [Actinobacillus pleuropneumoniae]|uniref:ACR3 family arsenite efflux transporter n=1 Tax=Actinobacillus pleuropneumoniae TaxID=715 RepID=A0A9Q4H5T0_ACTPL|nr:ACR3 family arsenite efflux transporter [Actinobacillus pleuropneumoniae]MCL7721017.1 ACR3 family arsenite efflux transporter [Actinobacillus pleuropneumoniae]MCL7726505.1 ACR3 family arsenite efflux transporter [Actinobacillus pleuropneumoniae]MCL7729009.1 ACR3 family arsenite efflux transporter [Actinobacillus pleuropneumoniae]MCY6368015.1 ACR3 family arsenite efflux transporter [Actinobacillus pleuropneumoniae]MCY6384884.1 ACR3 family arsenite efflux transporter [Actinobacillus pleuropne
MGIFERFLTIWVALAITAGVALGIAFPQVVEKVALLEIAHINLPVAVLIWLMIYPMMIQIDWSAIKDVGKKPKGLAMTIVVNWLIKPFTMALIGWLFFRFLFAAWVEPQTAQEYIAGMILLGVAPCTAMVFVRSQLVKGDPNYTLVQVSVNDIIMIFAFAPIAGFLLGVSDITIPWETLLYSTLLYVVLPLIAGSATRKILLKSNRSISQFGNKLKPFSMMGLILTVVLLFAFQAETILANPLIIVLIAIPLLVQTYGIFFLSHLVSKWLNLPKEIAAPACLIGTSNFFELAVAVAISLFGLHSGAALATVVGVLVEVPVMLSLVWWINRHNA